ncbi:MAG: hypothetical protein JWL84_2702 [Rhodospirillales bacterium]|nr:hypothetical protein [Rhodospirillales bacterium]
MGSKRDRSGRFAPGVSGNPAGKRKGTRNRATMMAMLLRVDESGAITRAIIDRALAGDMVAARFCLQQILPKKRGREIELDLPECHDIEGIVAAFGVTVAAMAAGEITPDEALTVSKVLDRRRRALEARARREKGEATQRPSSVVPDAPNVIPDPSSATPAPSIVIPANAGIHPSESAMPEPWIPACAGMTVIDGLESRTQPGLHFACKNTDSGIPAQTPPAAGKPLESSETPPRSPLPGFGSACIPPVKTRRNSRARAATPGQSGLNPAGERNRSPPVQISVSTWANFARTIGQVGVPAAR